MRKNNNIDIKFPVVLLLFFCLSVTGCVISGRVSTATYATPPQNSTFAIITNTMLTISEQKVQRHIIDKLSSLGFKQTHDTENVDYIVVYSYNIGSGQIYVSSSPDFVFGGQQVSSHTEYPRYFQIGIVDRKASIQSKKLFYAFQGEVYSSGRSSNIAYLAKYFIDQIFANYGLNVDDKHFVVLPGQ